MWVITQDVSPGKGKKFFYFKKFDFFYIDCCIVVSKWLRPGITYTIGRAKGMILVFQISNFL